MNKLAEETKVEKEVTEEVEENKEAEAEVVENLLTASRIAVSDVSYVYHYLMFYKFILYDI